MYQKLDKIVFPKYRGNIMVNMMPIIFGVDETVPTFLHEYLPIINKCNLLKGRHAYLTVHESFVKAGTSQRRAGIHTEGYNTGGWGGGWGGGLQENFEEEKPDAYKAGLFFASNDGSCNIWNCTIPTSQVNEYGQLLTKLYSEPHKMEANRLYWLTDRTPHEALRVGNDTERQFFRLVSEEISVWFSQHNTPNPLGVQPECAIELRSKFCNI
jgi:hypothetical protein